MDNSRRLKVSPKHSLPSSVEDGKEFLMEKQAMINLSARDYWTMMVSVHLGFECCCSSLRLSSINSTHTCSSLHCATREVESWNKKRTKLIFMKDFSFQIPFFNFSSRNYSWQIIQSSLLAFFSASFATLHQVNDILSLLHSEMRRILPVNFLLLALCRLNLAEGSSWVHCTTRRAREVQRN